MSYLIDTSVISETIKNHPDKTVIEWLEQVPSEALFVSVITLGEIRKGIEDLADKERKEKLRVWLEHDFTDWFEDRILPIDTEVADRWGRMIAETRHNIPVIDSLIAATALTHNLRLVTHNAQDYNYAGIEVIDPWED
jgi:toxin FitB